MVTTTIHAIYLSAVPSPRFSPTFIAGENSATCETVLTGPTLFPQQSRELREKTREEVSTRPAATRVVEEENDREEEGE